MGLTGSSMGKGRGWRLSDSVDGAGSLLGISGGPVRGCQGHAGHAEGVMEALLGVQGGQVVRWGWREGGAKEGRVRDAGAGIKGGECGRRQGRAEGW